jgi:hypothetical protein
MTRISPNHLVERGAAPKSDEQDEQDPPVLAQKTVGTAFFQVAGADPLPPHSPNISRCNGRLAERREFRDFVKEFRSEGRDLREAGSDGRRGLFPGNGIGEHRFDGRDPQAIALRARKRNEAQGKLAELLSVPLR